MKAFIAAGGRARWDFLIFEHNQHQVEEAEALATKWGFEKFVAKKTGRFVTGKGRAKQSIKQLIVKETKQQNLKSLMKNIKMLHLKNKTLLLTNTAVWMHTMMLHLLFVK
jgi:ubiquinone/menaquinone biosynthesis C-methylase UbiE